MCFGANFNLFSLATKATYLKYTTSFQGKLGRDVPPILFPGVPLPFLLCKYFITISRHRYRSWKNDRRLMLNLKRKEKKPRPAFTIVFFFPFAIHYLHDYSKTAVSGGSSGVTKSNVCEKAKACPFPDPQHFSREKKPPSYLIPASGEF